MSKPFYLIDPIRDKPNRKRIKYCEIASKILLRKGRKGLNNDVIAQMWDIEDLPTPSYSTVAHHVSVPNVKWYIRNKLRLDEPVWNGDFVAGLTTAGKILWSKRNFPSFRWARNRKLAHLIDSSPYHGKVSISKKSERYGSRWYVWSHVPALYLPYSKDSISFMAGVLATGHQRYRRGESYIRYNHQIEPYLRQWAIPIEFNCSKGIYISPIWPALLTYLMPECCQQWVNLPDAHKADFYAAILWNVYSGRKITRKKIPYLKSRQWAYDNKGQVQKLKDLWIEGKLAGMDKRIREAVHHWVKTV